MSQKISQVIVVREINRAIKPVNRVIQEDTLAAEGARNRLDRYYVKFLPGRNVLKDKKRYSHGKNEHSDVSTHTYLQESPARPSADLRRGA
jgi:hypothetical protein